VDKTGNNRENITYQVEVNVFYKNHMERMQMDVCNLGKIKVILGILWLQALKECKRKLHTGTNKIIICQLPIVY